jgi:hypothetical protein
VTPEKGKRKDSGGVSSGDDSKSESGSPDSDGKLNGVLVADVKEERVGGSEGAGSGGLDDISGILRYGSGVRRSPEGDRCVCVCLCVRVCVCDFGFECVCVCV